jgi:hypothetical protein
MLWRQNSITHSSQTPSCSGSLAIRIRIDGRAAAGQRPQQTQSSSVTDGSLESLIAPNSMLRRQPYIRARRLSTAGRDLALQVNMELGGFLYHKSARRSPAEAKPSHPRVGQKSVGPARGIMPSQEICGV